MDPAPRYGAQTKARKAALDVLFAAELRDVETMLLLSQLRQEQGTVRELTSQIVHGVAAHRDELDSWLGELLAKPWTVERMPGVDRNLARMALFELQYTETPAAAVISEAVRLASDLSTDESPAFLNGVLSAAVKSDRKEVDN